MKRLILNGQDQEIDIAFDVRIVGSGAAETLNIAHGNNVFFTAGEGDRVNLPGKLSDYTITGSGNQVFLAHNDGSSIVLAMGGKSHVGFANGTAALDMVFSPGATPHVQLGDVAVSENPLAHHEVALVIDEQDPNGNEPALTIDNFVVEPESPVAGEEFWVDVDFRETAAVWTDNLTVNLAVGEHFDETIDIACDNLVEIKNESAMIRFDGLAINEPGDYTLRATVDADNANRVSMEQQLTVKPFMPEVLSVTITNISAGEVGSEVTVAADVAHFGQAEAVTFTLQQDETRLSETVALQAVHPGEEQVTVAFGDTPMFDPGMVEVLLEVTENGIIAEDAETIGLYEAQENYSWEWANPQMSPFNMIGHTVVDRAGHSEGQYILGTGFLISPRHMMTNAHVLEDGWEGDLSSLNSVDFFLGRNGGALFEEKENNHYSGENVYLQKDEWGDKWPDTDMAIVYLDRDVEAFAGQSHFDWFWNDRDSEGRDLTGHSLFWGGYPSGGVDQGINESGNNLFFQWKTEGLFDDYITGYTAYGADSGGIRLSTEMTGAPGASGSPVFFQNEEEQYQFAGAFTGSKNGFPVAANLDPAAYDWALSIVQAEGYLLDMDFIDSPLDISDMGPHKGFADDESEPWQIQDFGITSIENEEILIHGVAADGWEDFQVG